MQDILPVLSGDEPILIQMEDKDLIKIGAVIFIAMLAATVLGGAIAKRI